MGGGSGGHVTPVVAVLRELKKQNETTEIRFWSDRKFAPHARSIVKHFDESVPVQTIYSGKFRRYNNLPLWRQIIRPSIILPNIRDFFLVGVGFLQSVTRLLFWRPDVVFTKGGFVCLPVGMAAKVLGVPLVIHDSDAHPGLTNRILGKWATSIATGAPLEHYNYSKDRAHYVGIPVAREFKPFNESQRREAREVLGVDPTRPLVVVTGGGLGAQRINNAVVKCLDELLKVTSIILVSGSGQYDDLATLTPNYMSDRFQLHSFVSKDMYVMLGAADIVVTRAGATTILELAALAKPTILIPNGYLTGGHQLKNAAVYAQKQAVVVLDEHVLDADATTLVTTVTELLGDAAKRQQLSVNFQAFSKPHAALDMANLILAAVK